MTSIDPNAHAILAAVDDVSRRDPAREATCPLCSGPNACVPAARGSFDRRCWCEDLTFTATALDAIPLPLRGRACVCRTCALSVGPQTSAPPTRI